MAMLFLIPICRISGLTHFRMALSLLTLSILSRVSLKIVTFLEWIVRWYSIGESTQFIKMVVSICAGIANDGLIFALGVALEVLIVSFLMLL